MTQTRKIFLVRWLFFAVVAGCISLAAVAFVPQQRDDALKRTRAHGAFLLSALSAASAPKGAADAEAAQRWIEAVQKALQSRAPLTEAMLIVEKAGEDLGFGIPLRETKIVAHSSKKRRGQTLKPNSDRDKEIFDITQDLDKQSKKKPGILRIQQLKESRQFLFAAPVLSAKGKYLGVVVARVPYLKPLESKASSPFVAYGLSWLLASALVGLGLLFVSSGWGHMFALFGLLGVSLYPYVDAVERKQRQDVQRLESQASLFQQILTHTPSTSTAWVQKALPKDRRGAALFSLTAKGQIQLEKALWKARPGAVSGWPQVGLGGLGLLAYLLFAFGWLGRVARTFLRHRSAYLYTIPAMAGMLLLVFVPFAVGIGLSFFQHTGAGQYEFVGLKHFGEILASKQHPFPSPLNFYFTLTVTIVWTVLNVALHVSIGLALALLLKNPMLRMKELYRVLLILPWAIPNYITALIWKGMFHQQFGAVNGMLSAAGMQKVHWFSEFSTAFTANLVTNTWLGFPFMMVVSLGALQSIPGDLYEAADVDGANRWQKFWYITLPLLKPALFPAIILGSIWTFNMFNVIYLVSQGRPERSTEILITEAYYWAFTHPGNLYGYAAAYSVIIFLILLGYSMATNKVTKATEGIFQD